MKILPALALLLVLFLIPTAFAQNADNCGGGQKPRAQGLVTSPSISGKFGTTGGCAIDAKVAFVPFKIPTFADLKSLYYDQSKAHKTTSLKGNNSDYIYTTGDNLIIDNPSDITGNNTGLIFVDKNLSITKDIKGNNSKSGIVFIVGGDVIIDQSVTQIDGVIISSGKIYTAGTGCSNTLPVTTSALTINGSLISLNQSDSVPIKFCRTLSNNNNPAEIINAQPKYLVILRDLMSDTYQKWSEIP